MPDTQQSRSSTIIEQMLEHRSIRQFKTTPIDAQTLALLIKAGQSAASSSFIQAYSVIQVTEVATRKQIAEAAGGQTWVEEAPEFLIYCADLKRVEYACLLHDAGKLEGYTEHFISATVDVALMAENVLLAAESLGLGGVFIGGIRNDPQLVSDLLKLPDQVYPVFGMCLGWPAVEPEVKPRFPVDVILHKDHYQADKVADAVNDYDQEFRAYYASRSTNNRVSDWSTQIAQAVQTKVREHMLSFLQSKGFLKK